MRKSFLLLFAFLTTMGNAFADKLIVNNLNVPKDGTASLEINYQFDVAELYSGYQFSLTLPEGITTVKNENGTSQFVVGDCHDSSYTISSSYVSGIDNYTALSLQAMPLKGASGVLLTIPVIGLETLNVGDKFTAKLTGIQFGNKDGVSTAYFEDVTFSITITEPVDPWITLDENSTTLPEASDGKTQIKVLRTIIANQWNTICLPFAMTESQVYEVFGEDVKLAEFMEYEANDDLSEISVTFDAALLGEDGFMANYPYIIKTSKDITEFMVTSTIEPDEENAISEFTNGRTGSRKEVYGTFYGTLKAGGILSNNNLFLNGGNFWYSAGNNSIKAFRGYFDFVDVLAAYDETAASAIHVVFNEGQTTGIKNLYNGIEEEKVYDLQGRQIVSPAKGLYIKGGKKYLVK